MPDYRYPWPSSALTESDMELLFHAREGAPVRTTITELVARAVRAAYGANSDIFPEPTTLIPRKEAA